MEGAGGQKLPLSPEPSRCRQSSKRGRQKAKRGSPVKATKSIPGRASVSAPRPWGARRKCSFPKELLRKRLTKASPTIHPSGGRTHDFTVVTDKGSHLPIAMPKKETRDTGVEEGQKRFP